MDICLDTNIISQLHLLIDNTFETALYQSHAGYQLYLRK